MCVISFAVRASTRDTVPSPWFRVQTDPAPVVRNRGCGPTSRVAVTWFVLGSTRVSRFFSGVVTHTAPSPSPHPCRFRRYLVLCPNFVRRRVDAGEHASGIGHEPHRVGTGRDAAFAFGGRDRQRGGPPGRSYICRRERFV